MLARADSALAGDAAGPAAPSPPAPPAITVEQFPGLCMGAAMLTSLSLHKIGFAPLTEDEGKALTAALLKNAEAWDLGTLLQNPKAAAALDLGGCLIAILMPRILADAKKREAARVNDNERQARAANDNEPAASAPAAG